MPRVRVRKTNRGSAPITAYEDAHREVVLEGKSLRSSAKKHGLNHVSLRRYILKTKEAEKKGSTERITMGYSSLAKKNKVKIAGHVVRFYCVKYITINVSV